MLPKSLPPSMVLEETGDVLTLRGVGVEKGVNGENYLGAFYSSNIVKDPEEALEDAGPKRMVFYFLRPISDFREMLSQAMRVNNSPEVMEREQLNVSQLLDFVPLMMEEGDSIIFDCIPDVGTKVTVRGVYRGTLREEAFYKLLLKIWMGRQPPSQPFQKDLFIQKHSLTR